MTRPWWKANTTKESKQDKLRSSTTAQQKPWFSCPLLLITYFLIFTIITILFTLVFFFFYCDHVLESLRLSSSLPLFLLPYCSVFLSATTATYLFLYCHFSLHLHIIISPCLPLTFFTILFSRLVYLFIYLLFLCSQIRQQGHYHSNHCNVFS